MDAKPRTFRLVKDLFSRMNESEYEVMQLKQSRGATGQMVHLQLWMVGDCVIGCQEVLHHICDLYRPSLSYKT